MKLSDQQVNQFQKDGILVVEGLLSPEEMGTLRKRTEDIAAGRVDFPGDKIEYEPGASGSELDLTRVRKINQGGKVDPVLAAHARHPGILEVIEAGPGRREAPCEYAGRCGGFFLFSPARGDPGASRASFCAAFFFICWRGSARQIKSLIVFLWVRNATGPVRYSNRTRFL